MISNMKIKKYVVIALWIVSLAISPVAEGKEPAADTVSPVERGVSKWRFNWGLTASIDIFFPGKCTSTEGKDPSQIGYGCSAGVKGIYECNEKWYFESGLLLAFGYSPVDVRLEESSDYRAGYYSYDMQRGAIQLPIHIGYRFRLTDEYSLRLSAGTQLSYGFAGSFDYDGEKSLPKYDLYGSNGVWKRFGADAVVGLHFDLNNLSVGINGNFGVTQMAKREIFSSHTMNESECRIDFTYWFGSR